MRRSDLLILECAMFPRYILRVYMDELMNRRLPYGTPNQESAANG